MYWLTVPSPIENAEGQATALIFFPAKPMRLSFAGYFRAWIGWGYACHPKQCGEADCHSTDDCDDHLPCFGRYRESGHAKGRRIPGNRSGTCKEGCNEGADPEGPCESERKLADNRHGTCGNCAQKDPPDGPRSSLISPQSGCDACQQWQRIDGKSEHEPTEKPDGDEQKNDIEDKHGECLLANRLNDCAIHHHLSAPKR